MAESGVEQAVSPQLLCPICNCRLRDPKDLDCSHTFCLRCLDQLVEIEPENGFKEQRVERIKTGKPNRQNYTKRQVIVCPVCKASTRMPLGGVANLRSNHVLRNLIETMSPRKSTGGFPDDLDESVLFGPVDVCASHLDEILTNFCKRCKKSLCQRCIVDHADHEHDVIGISDQAEHSREHLKAVIGKTMRRASRLKIAKEEAAQNEAIYHEAVSSVLQKVHYTASVAVAAINRQRAELVEEIERSKTAVFNSFDTRREFMDCFEESLHNTYEAAKVLLKERGDFEVVAMAPELCHALNRLCKEEPAHIVSIPPAQAPTFYPNRGAVDTSIGKLRVKNCVGTPNAEDTVDVGQINISDQNRILEVEWETSLKIKGGDRNGGPEIQLTRGIGSGHKDGIIAITDVTEDHVLVYDTKDGGYEFFLYFPVNSRKDNIRNPQDVAITADGIFLLVDKSRYVRVFDQNGEYTGHKFLTLSEADPEHTKVRLVAIAVDIHGIIVVADARREVLTLHLPDGSFKKLLQLKVEPSYIDVNNKEMIAVSGNLKILLLNYSGHHLLTIDAIGLESKRSLWAHGVCFDRVHDLLYVAHSKLFGDKSVHMFAVPSGRYLGCVTRGLNSPDGIAATIDGQVAVCDWSNVKVYKLKEGEEKFLPRTSSC